MNDSIPRTVGFCLAGVLLGEAVLLGDVVLLPAGLDVGPPAVLSGFAPSSGRTANSTSASTTATANPSSATISRVRGRLPGAGASGAAASGGAAGPTAARDRVSVVSSSGGAATGSTRVGGRR